MASSTKKKDKKSSMTVKEKELTSKLKKLKDAFRELMG
jgi:hypothetical protein